MDLKEPSPSDATDALSTFLAERKTEYLHAIDAGSAADWTVVMGNEAGDLDTLASSLAFAYHLHTSGTPAIALQQTAREDLGLRAENLHALALGGVAPSALLTLSDLPPTASSLWPSSQFALVDHNRLAPAFGAGRVRAVLDHHVDEGLYTDAQPRVVRSAGSCASLVALHLAEARAAVPRELATLLLSAVLIDTGGLKSGGKAGGVDRDAAAWLAPRSTLVGADANAEAAGLQADLDGAPAVRALTNALLTRKAGVDHLGTRDLLRRDYKEYAYAAGGAEVRVGLASVPLGLRAWLGKERERFGAEARAWMEERGLQVLGVLTSFRDAEHAKPGKLGKHRREQMYVVRGEDAQTLARTLFEGLEKKAELRLKSKGWKYWGVRREEVGLDEEDVVVGVWKQKNVEATRKATAPLVKSIIEGNL